MPVHGVQDVCPWSGCAVPSLQALHVDCPSRSWKVPGMHCADTTPTHELPALQITQREGPWRRKPRLHLLHVDLSLLANTLQLRTVLEQIRSLVRVGGLTSRNPAPQAVMFLQTRSEVGVLGDSSYSLGRHTRASMHEVWPL